MVSGPVMKALPAPVLLALSRTAYFEARYIGFASSSPLAPDGLGTPWALCAAVAVASAARIAALASPSTEAPLVRIDVRRIGAGPRSRRRRVSFGWQRTIGAAHQPVGRLEGGAELILGG